MRYNRRSFRAFGVWALIAYLGLVTGFILYVDHSHNQLDKLVELVDHNQTRLNRLFRTQCEFTVFTRNTQKEVILLLEQRSKILSDYSIEPELQSLFEAQKERMNTLLKRTAQPPKCKEIP